MTLEEAVEAVRACDARLKQARDAQECCHRVSQELWRSAEAASDELNKARRQLNDLIVPPEVRS